MGKGKVLAGKPDNVSLTSGTPHGGKRAFISTGYVNASVCTRNTGHACIHVVPKGARRGHQTGILHGCKPSCKCWEPNPGSLQEQVLLTP